MPKIPTPAIEAHRPDQLLGRLTEIQSRNAPPVLFTAGDTSLLADTVRVSVVGSRHPSEEGSRRAIKLAAALVSKGAVVVSGLAEGIDTAAHATAMRTGGRTIAVLGTPLNEVFPAKNAELQAGIMEKHLAVSQFPIGMPTAKGNFPRRNRTMALISHASVIVEAGNSSGSLSQGWEALRLGRPLFIMKSIVMRADLTWPAEMISYGAIVLSDPDEIDSYLPLSVGGAVPVPAF